jgi:DNA repair exonuclease SbcCD ATPase subunit
MDRQRLHQNNVQSVDNWQKNLQEQEKQLDSLRLQKALVGRTGFLGSIFDEVLQEIEMRANGMMQHLPNISSFALSLSSTSTTKTGEVRKEISKKIFKDGEEKSIQDLSGGQQAGVELCVDLAVAETVKRRTGTHLGWMALDEAMDGLGVIEKQAALDVIRSQVGGLVFIVDHATEIKEGFEQVIEIEYDGRESHVISA